MVSGRPALGRPERAEHDGRAAGDAVDLGPAPEGADGREPELGAALEVRLAVRVGGHARDLDELLQQLLELAALPSRRIAGAGAG